MSQTQKLSKTIVAVLIMGAMLAIFTACSDSDDTSSPTSTSIAAPTNTAVVVVEQPTATNVPEPTATPVPEPTATIAPVEPTEVPVGSGDLEFEDPTGQFDQELLAIGKEVFDVTAGGLGCAFCHGLDGKGNGPAGIGAPANRGMDKSKFDAAISDGESGAMEFLDGQLTSSEEKAVIEYLGWLGTQP